jgi:hypothetical protein
MPAAKILAEKRAHGTLFCHQEKSLQDNWASWAFRFHPVSHECAGASWTSLAKWYRVGSGRPEDKVCAGMTLQAVLATDCAGNAVPHAFVSLAQRQAIARFSVSKLWLAYGSHSAGCPADVLGAEAVDGRFRLYTVVRCTSCTAQCAAMTDYTEGLVARRRRSKRQEPSPGPASIPVQEVSVGWAAI